MSPLGTHHSLDEDETMYGPLLALVSGLKTCLLTIKPLFFPGLDGCASVALVYAWRVSREKISRQPGEPGAVSGSVILILTGVRGEIRGQEV